eukprot:gene9211-19107_t
MNVEEFTVFKKYYADLRTLNEMQRLVPEIPWKGTVHGYVVELVSRGFYDGEWKIDMSREIHNGRYTFHGKGIYFDTTKKHNGQYYIGDFKRNQYAGHGILLWLPSCSIWKENKNPFKPAIFNGKPFIYEGTFKNDTPSHGTGICIFKDDSSIEVICKGENKVEPIKNHALISNSGYLRKIFNNANYYLPPDTNTSIFSTTSTSEDTLSTDRIRSPPLLSPPLSSSLSPLPISVELSQSETAIIKVDEDEDEQTNKISNTYYTTSTTDTDTNITANTSLTNITTITDDTNTIDTAIHQSSTTTSYSPFINPNTQTQNNTQTHTHTQIIGTGTVKKRGRPRKIDSDTHGYKHRNTDYVNTASPLLIQHQLLCNLTVDDMVDMSVDKLTFFLDPVGRCRTCDRPAGLHPRR